MTRHLLTVIGFVAALALITACKSSKSSVTYNTAAYHSHETEVVGTSMDGFVTLRVYGTGNNRQDAIEQAKKKAVYDLTFSGVTAGSGSANSWPVVTEANARTKYQDYFDAFFTTGGAYTKYVSTQGNAQATTKKFESGDLKTFSIVVTVDRSALTKRYKDDNVIP